MIRMTLWCNAMAMRSHVEHGGQKLAVAPVSERVHMTRHPVAQVFVDVTAEVQARIQRGFLCSTYNGHIHTAEASPLPVPWRTQHLEAKL